MLRGGTPEIRQLFEIAEPYTGLVKRPVWFREVAKKINNKPGRIRDLFYTGETKAKPWEEEALLKRVQEQIKQNQIKSAYLQNKITGELNEQSTFETSPHTHTACHGF